MQLLALSDLHLAHPENRALVEALSPHPDDWLVLAGDLGEKTAHLEWAFRALGPKFARLIWVPGNHELWTPPSEPDGLRGLARYDAMVRTCREHGVLTPEDPWPTWPEDPGLHICPLFLLYDYSFAPDGLDPSAAVAWAAKDRIRARDEELLHPDPWPTREAWCAARVARTAERLEATPGPKVLINHWPLRRDLVRIPRVPRYLPWCGTRATEDWHVRYDARVVVSGHLHVPATDWRDGVRFEEVSVGYPRERWDDRTADLHLRCILPHPPAPATPDTVWHRRKTT
ncbi:MAG: metallophosphoesterase [Alphaproteobacteria bacterium]|nr:metallophosphoesterase [Alphaproteobacteria bacterium]